MEYQPEMKVSEKSLYFYIMFIMVYVCGDILLWRMSKIFE